MTAVRISKQLQVGKAGEYLVCADLILKGFIAFPSEQGLPYDVVLDIGGKMLRVQVKTTSKPLIVPQRAKDMVAYQFGVKRAGKNNKKIYSTSDFDIIALVCLDTMEIGYLLNKEMPSTINIRVDALRGSYYDEKGLQDYHTALDLSKIIKSQTEIAKKMGISISQVNRYLKKGYKPHLTDARYFSDFIRSAEWFENLK